MRQVGNNQIPLTGSIGDGGVPDLIRINYSWYFVTVGEGSTQAKIVSVGAGSEPAQYDGNTLITAPRLLSTYSQHCSIASLPFPFQNSCIYH